MRKCFHEKDTLGEEFYSKFGGEKGSLQLDDSLDSFFDRCHLLMIRWKRRVY